MDRRAELFNELAASVARELQHFGLPDINQATAAATCIADLIAREWGGQYIYVPKNLRAGMVERDIEIERRLGSESAADLAKEFGVSAIRIYQIVKRVREARKLPTNEHAQPLAAA